MESEKSSSVSQYLRSLFCTKSGLLLAVCILLFVSALFVLLLNTVRRDDRKAVLVNSVESEQAQMQELSGTVLMLGEGNAFIQLGVTKDSLYSVGINTDTKVTRDGAAFSLTALEPFSKVTIIALKLPNTESYDFLAQTIDVSVVAGANLEGNVLDEMRSGLIMGAN
ncbi:MAG: hypothetical protein A2845_05135 [Candidatus Lloydbacteria bacterium RIFCSPHIGHO2_01_FULL_49_22]|uniref:Uncharacterized protein n=1 Tax=Candidatus Lloydbacteria bacterium RIFCSPHIGHO2_01_FULL_49_22 TaxID=1798658 RepID=A0A1G2CUB6_9BACT|nr:MAG: hypothetical protein A2845_05135 [Candidatus Lloydbacteria bacterium RIFCSPHIGHO2_01_FULL_49_22]OGZ09512.1 MAG: hypothetical protein A3C14_01690 [Candidatus Lloydbacteria bacterium RIFCSPHIGHO2_02_FULL_50_18]